MITLKKKKTNTSSIISVIKKIIQELALEKKLANKPKLKANFFLSDSLFRLFLQMHHQHLHVSNFSLFINVLQEHSQTTSQEVQHTHF